MEVRELKKGEVLHVAGSTVSTIEIISKGEITASNESTSMSLKGGMFAGLSEAPGQPYAYTYTAQTDSTVASYPYNTTEDIVAVMKANPKIAPILVSNIYKIQLMAYEAVKTQKEQTEQAYTQLQENYEQYPYLCTTAGSQLQEFPEVKNAPQPPKTNLANDWMLNYMHSMLNHDADLRKSFYLMSLDVDIALVMSSMQFLYRMTQNAIVFSEYIRDLQKQTLAFRNAYNMVKAKSDMISQGGTADTGEVPEFKDVLSTILAFGDVDHEMAEKFTTAVNNFKNSTTTDAYSDEYRRVRRDVSADFYKIYHAVFIKSLSESIIPDAVQMFLMFGYTDEDLINQEQTAALYRIMKSYAPDPNGRVFTMPEWLRKIYNGEVMPSRNEFNLDYPGYLREQKTQGNISEEEMEKLMDDMGARVDFEITNLFMLGNRVTNGRASSFVPVFTEDNITKPLPDAFMTAKTLQDATDSICHDDFSLFYRDVMYSNPEIGLNTFVRSVEVLPFFILMPNCGNKISLWQEIEGRHRDTPARFCISIFHTAELYDTLLMGFGDYRWEMCKTIQGVHWNDVTDPSLTSEYCDYLQFYKKNRVLTADQKEKLQIQLKKYSNHYNQVFIADYYTFMKFEKAGSLRLNKVSRQILFSYCPFSKELREKIAASPQYADLLRAFETKNATAAHTLENVVAKIEKGGFEVPQEVLEQQKVLQL